MLTLQEALSALPDTADGIAEFLRERQIRGVAGSACQCPLAAYLLACGLRDPIVSRTGIRVRGTYGWEKRDPRVAVMEFMARFDGGEWPELALKPGETVDGDAQG